MAWYIVPFVRDGFVAGFPSRTLAINPLLVKTRGVTSHDFDFIEVRGNRAVVRVEADAAKVGQIDGLFYRLPIDDLVSKLDKVEISGMNDQLLDMGYSQDEIGAAFPDGLSQITLKEFINFAQSIVWRMKYDEKTDEIIEDVGRANNIKNDPVEVDSRVSGKADTIKTVAGL
jgi:hypothetical protein